MSLNDTIADLQRQVKQLTIARDKGLERVHALEKQPFVQDNAQLRQSLGRLQARIGKGVKAWQVGTVIFAVETAARERAAKTDLPSKPVTVIDGHGDGL